ncbi:M14 family zinc carboxypeptidase [Algoriphagus sediminis]|uniref:M14 family zinc carboxypeptidase n=1 Tax=Algoriphagus sediminis TaxID=3057113 RepID=A0ABT7YCA2_9BACT|nr:M14 family zinc carboxypeptidase [Algoriphagus sediminis]MDN3204157.1 M14 family zinc carboxypeptidase [Algoriphagus sediminis]
MKKSISLFLLFSILIFSCKTANEEEVEALSIATLESAFDTYKEPQITDRRFKHSDLQPLIKKHEGAFKIEELGKSVEGRSISSLDWGEGETKVLLWSQMHGNESTATMSLFDLFNFLEAENDEFDELRNTLRQRLSIKFIPMLNPDGAEEFKRRNALDIDLNRDAVSQISPEAIILKGTRDSFEPEFGFNLHDQQIYYNVGDTPKQATISVLAPAYNEERDNNEVRMRAMQTIVGMNRILQQLIPGQVGQYNDSFEPRAFGDNIQKWGTSTILIESGGYFGDPEKQYIRELNFIIILNALHQIATESYVQYTEEEYFDIPDNSIKLVDLILHELTVPLNGQDFQLDLAIRRREVNSGDSYYVNGVVDDLGDVQTYFGMEELDATGYRIKEGEIFSQSFENVDDIDEAEALELLRQGFLAVKAENFEEGQLHGLPILVLGSGEEFDSGWQLGETPTFLLEKDGSIEYAVVNGYLIDLKEPKDQSFNQVVY